MPLFIPEFHEPEAGTKIGVSIRGRGMEFPVKEISIAIAPDDDNPRVDRVVVRFAPDKGQGLDDRTDGYIVIDEASAAKLADMLQNAVGNMRTKAIENTLDLPTHPGDDKTVPDLWLPQGVTTDPDFKG